MRRMTIAAGVALLAFAFAAPAGAQDDGDGGASIGGSVPSFMALSISVDQASKTIRAGVTSTDYPTTLTVADADFFKPFADALVATWLKPITNAPRTIPFRLASTPTSTILITVSSESP